MLNKVLKGVWKLLGWDRVRPAASNCWVLLGRFLGLPGINRGIFIGIRSYSRHATKDLGNAYLCVVNLCVVRWRLHALSRYGGMGWDGFSGALGSFPGIM